jgi:hypothetical protein
MSTIYKKIGLEENQKRMFLITFPQALLIVVLLGLLVLLVRTCIQFTKGSLSTTALKQQLLQLESKFAGSAPINPEAERKEMEILQNKIKTSSDQLTISGDKDLQELFASNCKYIQSIMADGNLANRSSWIKFKELMFGFGNSYFHVSSTPHNSRVWFDFVQTNK